MAAIGKWFYGVIVILFVLNSNVHGIGFADILPSSTKDDKSSDSRASRFGLGNILSSARDVTTGVVEDIGKVLPSPEALFDAGKQAIAGYPFAFVSSAINKFCSAALSSQTISPKYTPDIRKMQFQLRTRCQRHNFPLLEADKLLKSPDFDRKKKVVVLASGWTSNVNDTEIIEAIGKAYLCRGDTNFIAVDAAAFVDTLYTWSAFNTEEIGKHIAQGLKLIMNEIPLENIHLIGHSLGAHIVGAAGRYFNYMTGKVIPRITGLDPAKPCFNEGENLSGLMRGDAEFIDVIHSNNGVLGKREPVGDADFYPGGLSPLPPGCLDISCAHARAWEYYAETVYPNNENNFMARRCGSLTKLREDKCPGTDFAMGFAVPHNLKGNYFLEVRRDSPFGEAGDTQRTLMSKDCGLCKAGRH